MHSPAAPTLRQRALAALALAAAAAAVAAQIGIATRAFPNGLVAAMLASGGLWAGWQALIRRGPTQLAAAVFSLGMIAVSVAVLVANELLLELVGSAVLIVFALGAARRALGVDVRALNGVDPPGTPVGPATRGVLIINPKSGDGRIPADGLIAAARAHGAEPVVLGPDDDLRELAERAAEGGADVLGMAGGDGSQALVASVAAAHRLGYVCVPSGTRNHFALDLGIDRTDAIGAVAAFGDAAERPVDLGRVNGRPFVNNASLGVYATIVQADGYRERKLGTAAEMLPQILGPEADGFDLRYRGPHGDEHGEAQLIFVANNRYTLDAGPGFGSRARLDAGTLRVVAAQMRTPAQATELVARMAAGRGPGMHGWREWSAREFDVDSGTEIEIAVDGEALRLTPPLHFEVEPGALRVRIAPAHPGVSPAGLSRQRGRTLLQRLLNTMRGRVAR
ncbi:MAG: diacylglycerol/lipid kinase family protein [Solirubrobacteraceae bacterium]